jgi:hypothetical protein
MAKSKAESARSVFLFSYHEHDWDTGEEEQGDFTQRFLQEAQQRSWAPVEAGTPDEIDQYLDPEVTTVEALRAWCEEVLSDYEYPEGTLDAPFAKLNAKMKAEGWKFVSGVFYEFEGNHNDTEIFVVLEKTAQRPPAKKAPTKKPTTKKPPKKTPAKKPKTAKKPAAKKKK